MGFLTKIISSVVKATEGSYRPGPYYLPVTGGWLSAEVGQYCNFWQKGYDVEPFGMHSAMVEACVSAYSQTVAMCPGSHWRATAKGGRERITSSALSRILRQPNDYQSISDFLLNAVRHLYLDGNAYALCLRNERYEISELHLMDPRMSRPQILEGEVFYTLGGNNIIHERMGETFPQWCPARDVLHFRLHASARRQNFPLHGESPITAAAADIASADAMKAQQLQFFNNSARPSFVLSTDQMLDKDQTQFLRDRWNEQTRGGGAGGTPILSGGLKPLPIQMRSRDAQLAELMAMSNQDIALAFRIPMALLGLSGGASKSVEVLMQEWVASGLGFCLNHIEEAIGLTFKLWGQPDEYVEFDTASLLRSAFKDRISALKEGVIGGILSPNEARNLEGLDDVEYGDEPRVQQQVVPLSAAASIPQPGAGGAIGGPAPPAPGPVAPPSSSPQIVKPDTEASPAKSIRHRDFTNNVARFQRSLYSAADEYDRRRAV